jgi:hypothetical protein
MECYGQFDNSQAGSEMTGIGTNGINNEITEFIRYADKICPVEFPEIGRG